MEENKYLFDFEEIDEKLEAERREQRKKKHRQSRIISWVVMAALICGAVVAGVFFIKNMKPDEVPEKVVSVSQPEEQEPLPSIDEPVEDWFVDEDIIDIPSIISSGPSEEELFADAVTQYVATMSEEDKVAGLFITAPEQITGVEKVTRAGDGTKTALNKYAVGGIVYDSKNIEDKDQFKTMIANTVSYARYPLFTVINEELGKGVLASALKLGNTKNPTEIGEGYNPLDAYENETVIADYLVEYGINTNMGVVADLIHGDDTTEAAKSSFGSEPVIVGQIVSQEIAALTEKGINAAVKFFPGQVTASQDTASGVATVSLSKEELQASDFVSFKAAIDLGAAMVIVSHASVPALDESMTPCSMSKAVMTDLLRVEMGYDDLIIVTDAMNKAAISEYYDSKEAAVNAIKAGADMVLLPENFEEAYNGVLEAVKSGVIAKERIDDSLVRIYKAKFNGLSSEEVLAKFSTEGE